MKNLSFVNSMPTLTSSSNTYNSDLLYDDLDYLKNKFPFIEIGSIGKSVLGKNIPYAKIGTGKKEAFYSASFHANEWITSLVIIKFLYDYCYSYSNNFKIFNYNAKYK